MSRLPSLREALEAAGGHHGLAALATVSDKAARTRWCHWPANSACRSRPFRPTILAGVETATRSERIAAKFGVGSLAEAVALVAAGRNARLVSSRVVSQDRTATAAIAEGEGP